MCRGRNGGSFMTKKILLATLAVFIIALGVATCRQAGQTSTPPVKRTSARQEPDTAKPLLASPAAPVPAHFESAPSLTRLSLTLPPEKFSGPTRAAYRAAGEIPQTLAQLPCYCHCDQSMGHKNLHSCFEDDHAAYCAVCAGEALLAYRLEKEQGLTAPQIRARIIAEYSKH